MTLSAEPFIVGVDIGGTKIIVCILDSKGNVYFRKKYPTTSDYHKLSEIIFQCIDEASLSIESITAIGFGMLGIPEYAIVRAVGGILLLTKTRLRRYDGEIRKYILDKDRQTY